MDKKQAPARPSSSKNKTSNSFKTQPEEITFEVSGKKLQKGHKLPEKYQVSKPNMKPSSPALSKTFQSQLSEEIKEEFKEEYTPPNQFETYMQVKMVNPENKQIYKEIKPNDEFKKITSKPFNTSKNKFHSDKQVLANTNNVSQIVSEDSTQLSSKKQMNNNNDLPRIILQNNQEGLEREDTVYSEYQKDDKKPFKLSDITTKDQEQQPVNFQNWRINDKNNQKSKKQSIQELNEYVNKVKKDKNLDKQFDNMVDQAVIKMQQEDEISENNSKIFDYEEYKRENEDMHQLDNDLATQEAQEQRYKLKKLNEMLEESIDSLSQLSQQELKNRHVFITDICRQSSRQKQQQKVEMEESKMEELKEDEEEEEEEFEMYKTPNTGPIVKMNKQTAWMSILEKLDFEMVCNKLPQEQQDRLEFLLQDVEKFNDDDYDQNQIFKEPNPYNQEYTQEQKNQESNLLDLVLDLNDEEINLNLGILDETILPKDKKLKTEAEERILREKNDHINQELMNLTQQNPKQDKQKVKVLCEKLRDSYDYTPSNFLLVRRREFEELRDLNIESQEILESLEQNKDILQDLQQMKIHVQKQIVKVKNGDVIQDDRDESIYQHQDHLKRYNGICNLFQEIRVDEERLMQNYQQWVDEMKMLEKMCQPLQEESENVIQSINQKIQQQQPTQEEIDQLDLQISQIIRQKQPQLFDDINEIQQEDNYSPEKQDFQFN